MVLFEMLDASTTPAAHSLKVQMMMYWDVEGFIYDAIFWKLVCVLNLLRLHVYTDTLKAHSVLVDPVGTFKKPFYTVV